MLRFPALMLLTCTAVFAEDWAQFQGPRGMAPRRKPDVLSAGRLYIRCPEQLICYPLK